MGKTEFFNKLDSGTRFNFAMKDGETETLIKMPTACRMLFGEKTEFNAIFSDTAQPYPALFTIMDLVTVVSS